MDRKSIRNETRFGLVEIKYLIWRLGPVGRILLAVEAADGSRVLIIEARSVYHFRYQSKVCYRSDKSCLCREFFIAMDRFGNNVWMGFGEIWVSFKFRNKFILNCDNR